MRNVLRAVAFIATTFLLATGIVVPQSVSAGALVQQNAQAIDPEVAKAISENERTANLMEHWIGYIDSFIRQNEDGTFSLDAQGFEQALRRDHPELFVAIASEYPLLNENVRTIATLFQSMEAGNTYIRQNDDPRLAFGEQFWYPEYYASVVRPNAPSIAVAWPFAESPWDWRGWDGMRSGGTPWGGCFGHTHAGADYYARDLSRKTGDSRHRIVLAGISGKIIRARYDGGYGNSVVIYDESRHIALRYSHLQIIANDLYEGKWVGVGHILGTVGNSGCGSCGAHLHLVAYENVNQGHVPYICNGEWYACAIFFYCR